MDRQRSFGLSLFEVLIVVATTSTVTAIAQPLYIHHLLKSARADAQSFLVSAAAIQQQCLRERLRCADDLNTLSAEPPVNLIGKYAFRLATTTDGPQPTFTLTAIAAGEQVRDACPVMTLDSGGEKFPGTCW